MKELDRLAIKNNFEVWRSVKNYPSYSVSSNGKVKNNKFNKILKPDIKRGYYYVNLSKVGRDRKFYVHKLVAEAFTENINNKKCVDHKNNNRLDNNISNLRFVTTQENQFNAKLKNNVSGFKGVSFIKKTNNWYANISVDGKSQSIGFYDNKMKRQ